MKNQQGKGRETSGGETMREKVGEMVKEKQRSQHDSPSDISTSLNKVRTYVRMSCYTIVRYITK